MSGQITLPSEEEIMRRLNQADIPSLSKRAKADFYPLIAQEGGKEFTVEELVVMLLQKIDAFGSPDQLIIVTNLLHRSIPGLIETLVDDWLLAAEAMVFYQDECFARLLEALSHS